ncbi:flotillin family protein [Cyanobacteria bacterium FACHB-471]|nr:flotillin family protein [Cyanobacteria bacterium FACHB-471]
METILALLIALGAGTGVGTLVLRNLYYICQPSEILIFAGSRRTLSNGRKVGYRLVKGGSSVRVPLLERAFRMDLTNLIIDLRVISAYSKGGIPLTVEGVANIKIAGEEPTIHNAIERLLGKSQKEIMQMAKETLEGNLRGVLASLTPEQINEDKSAFARSLLEEAEDDLEKLGLVLDNLQIQNISDDVQYLNSIGRKQRADLLRDARIAEAQAQAESAIRTAANQQTTSLKQIETKIEIAKAEADQRIQDALTKRTAVIAEAEGEIAAIVARTQANVAVQTERIKQVEQQLQADVVAPAEAECKRAIAQAKGNASRIIEDGKAQALGTKRLTESWKAAGPNAREIFLFQKLEVLLKTLTSTVPDIDVQNVSVIDTANGGTATQVASFLEQLRQSSGIDVAGMTRRFANDVSPGTAAISSSPPVTVPSDKVAAVVPLNSLTEDTSLTALRSDIQKLLEKLAQSNPTPQQAEQSVEQAIQQYPTLKRRLQKAMDVGGREALKAVFAHPFIQIPASMLEAWVEEK